MREQDQIDTWTAEKHFAIKMQMTEGKDRVRSSWQACNSLARHRQDQSAAAERSDKIRVESKV